MIPITVMLALLFTHWVADFIFQTDWMAKNKSSSNFPLFIHCLVYSLFFIPFALWAIPTAMLFWFISSTLLLHMYVDFITSKITSKLAAKGKYGSKTVPNFGMFSIIGLDQMLHYFFLIGTYYFYTAY